ncbi:MAG: DUF6498-containing protein [Cytophagaceae bacterium]
MKALAASTHKDISSLVVIIFFNLITLVSAWVWNLSLYTILLIYLLECVIIALYSLLKIFIVRDRENFSNLAALWFYKLFFFPLYIAVVGSMLGGYIYYIHELYGGGKKSQFSTYGENLDFIWLAVVSIFLSYGFSFIKDFLISGEYKTLTIVNLFGRVFLRIIMLNIFLMIVSGFLAYFFTQQAAILFLILLKIGFDIFQNKYILHM